MSCSSTAWGIRAKLARRNNVRLSARGEGVSPASASLAIMNESIGFQELKESVGSISSRVLSVRLRQMEALGLIRRDIVDGRPPRTRYSLTPDGLTVAHFTESALAGCSESGLVNCTKVTTSPESYAFGIPVAVLGLAFFVFAVAIMSPWAWQASRREIHLARIASLVVGIGFVLYLVYAELFIIGSICLYCTSVHAITFVLFVLTAFAAAVWGLKPGAPWKLVPARKPE